MTELREHYEPFPREHLFGELSTRVVAARLRVSVLGEAFEPVRIGKFVLHGRLGAGAMGVVHAGYDETLDRRVAIKLIHRADQPDEVEGAIDARVLREAQALARLDHPNVVKVYDAGVYRDRLYIAMEFVAGQTLGQWCRNERHPWRQIVHVYRQAGRGLAAAHAAGLVHRDFKPDNAMRGEDGRVRVMDFGLARGIADTGQSPTESSGPGSTDDKDPLASPLTRSGVLVGTPAYMAPEQLAGKTADARSDQFSLCVALWEALEGVRPYTGNSLRELSAAFDHGHPALPPGRGAAPSWVRRVLSRGLSVDPAERWPSMDVLIAELGRDPSRKRMRVAAVFAGLTCLVVFGAWRWSDHQGRVVQCERDGEAIAEVWRAEDASRLQSAFASADPIGGAETSTRVVEHLDAFVEQWRDQRRASCTAAQIDRTQTEAVYALTVACLDERRDALAGLVEGLADPTLRLMRNAVLSASGLPSIQSCSDEAWLAHRVAPPQEAAARDQVALLRRKLAESTALHQLGRYDEAYRIATELREPAEQVAYPPLQAEVILRIGSLASLRGNYDEAEQELERALLLAGRHGHDAVTMDAYALLTWVVGYHLHRHAEGLRLAKLGEMTLARFGQERTPRAAVLLAYVASIHEEVGDLSAALSAYERALALAQDALGPDHPRVAAALANLGGMYQTRGEYERALPYLHRALALREETLGPRHPHVGQSLHALALVYSDTQRFDLAEADYRRAMSIFADAFGPDHPTAATVMHNLGRLELDRGNRDAAIDLHREALQRRLAANGPDHPDVASSRNGLGHVLTLTGQLELAAAEFKESRRINEAVYGHDHPEVAISLGYLGTTYRRMERYDEAIAALTEALAIQEVALGPDHVNISVTLGFLGEAYVALERWGEALTAYRRTLTIRENALGDAHSQTVEARLLTATALIGSGAGTEAIALLESVIEAAPTIAGIPTLEPAARFELARALWDNEPDRPRAAALAEEARETFAAAGPSGEKTLAEIEGWIASREVEAPGTEKETPKL